MVLNYGYGTTSVCFEVTLKSGRVPVSESCGELMIANDHEKDLFSLLEALKDTMESQ